MKIFKILLQIVFATAAILNAWVGILNFSGGNARFIGMVLFYVNLIDYPLLIAFIFVVSFNCLFRRKPISFFKIELIYLFIKICAIVLLGLSYINCPECPG